MKLHAEFRRDDGHVRLTLSRSQVYYWMSLASAVDSDTHEEECELETSSGAALPGGGWWADVTWKSSLWRSKTHRYRFENSRLTHWIEVEGNGYVSRLTYGSGTVSGREQGSVPGFGAVYVGCPNFIEKPYSHPSEYTAISAGNVTELWGSALNTGPLLFAFGETGQAGWLGAGLLARPGQYGFQTMALNLKRQHALATHDNIIGTQAITLDYAGREKVEGTWTSPKLVFSAGREPGDCLQAYCRSVYREGYAPRRAPRRVSWWREPIFCTWHEQGALARLQAPPNAGQTALAAVAPAFDQLTETNLRRWLGIFEQHEIRFGTLILDARWQKDDGSNEADPAKFPNFRGLMDELHERGYRVLLWLTAWETKNIPQDWCVHRGEQPVMADPTHPAYREYVRQMLQRLLGQGPGDYNADGLKIDGTSVLPGGKGLRSHGDLYGFELLHSYLQLLYDTAHAAKADALVSIFGANPYLADCCDMVRLGDLYTFRGDPVQTMRWRAEVFKAGLPHALVDTDGTWYFSVREDAAELLAEQVALGIPCLYQAEHVHKSRAFVPETVRKMTTAEYRLIRDTLHAYRRQNGLLGKDT
jgi:hypothetical protein